MTKKLTYVHVADGKYTVVSGDGDLKALRYGEEWRDCCGDNLIYWLAIELDAARKEIVKLKQNPMEKMVGSDKTYRGTFGYLDRDRLLSDLVKMYYSEHGNKKDVFTYAQYVGVNRDELQEAIQNRRGRGI